MRLNYRLAEALGYDLVRTRRNLQPPIRRHVAQVLAAHAVTCVIDVGANVGQYGRDLREAGFRGRIVSFEPQPSAQAELAAAARGDPAWGVHALALGREEGQATLYDCGRSQLASLRRRLRGDRLLSRLPRATGAAAGRVRLRDGPARQAASRPARMRAGSHWAPAAGRGLALVALLAWPVAVRSQGADAEAGAPKLTTLASAGEPDVCLDVLFVGEGYSKGGGERKFKKDLERYGERLLETQPFCWYRDHVNVRGAFLPSKDDGCDPAADVEEADTILNACFRDKEGRSLYFRDHAALARIVAASGPVEMVIVMVNTERYGGAGTVLSTVEVGGRPLPAPTFAAQDTPSFRIALHELGHSFAGLSDEYEEESKHDRYPLPEEGDVDAPNATLPSAVDRTSFETLAATVKWRHFLALKDAKRFEWLHEGGHYRAKGVYRPWQVCLMRELDQEFCPICSEEVAKAIVALTGQPWDDAAFHAAHPLKLWRARH